MRPAAAEFAVLATRYARIPVVRSLTADALTPTGMLLRLARAGRSPFLLESVEGRDAVARWSVAGVNPRRSVVGHGARISIDGVDQVGRPLEVLRRLLVPQERVPLDDLPPFAGGMVGWLGFDVARLAEGQTSRLPDPLGVPDIWLGQYPAVAVLDRVAQRLLLVTTADVTVGAEVAWNLANERLDALESALAAPSPEVRPITVPALDAGPQPDGSWEVAPDDERFLAAAARLAETVAAGECFEVVLSRRWSRPLGVSPLMLYRACRLLTPLPYVFYLDSGEVQVIGAAPDSMARLRGRTASTAPVAGRRRRGRTAAEEAHLAAELTADERIRSEHLLLVDMARNDLGKVCRPGTIEVTRFMEIERFSHALHLASEVRGEVAPGKEALDVALACLPSPSLVGAPKPRALALIDELEVLKRGVWAGAVGYFDAAGDMDLCPVNRAAVVTRGTVHVQAGSAVIFDSLPESELAECANNALRPALAVVLARGMQP
ncbi:MAG: chorismate-binding protein [Thermoanaerobaculaceae bacterium]|nr:chorismate-binding protein [Thermoanaerobaculaceae bacterium]MDI9621857.1 anthranilate synthase component I family protein [Acidobacteriota bacterium]NLH11043.1 anthranilate synthase component I [Holophagae bacterium]HPW54428.1 anthranilate synthase component I family protein [Thermoanaerobaculaceae bacterium]